MKLSVNEKDNAEFSGIEARAFKMEVNAKMYDMMLSKLYKDKEGSIVRELSCNAWDAHVDAGNTAKPFDIHLPTWLDPSVTFRDYGTGIPHDKFEDIYTNVGASTKENSNEFIGAMGLGSKSPFALTDSFTVNNYFDGRKTSWVCFKNGGIPTVTKVIDEETDQPNGLEVSFVIPETSVDHFIASVPRQLRFFPVKPNVHGRNITWEQIPDHTGREWFQYKRGDLHYRDWNTYTGYILMGNVAYEFDYTRLPSEYHQLMTGTTLVIKVPLGSIDIPPNRESVEWTDKTKKTIDGIMANIYKDYKDDVIKQISNIKTPKELYLWAKNASIKGFTKKELENTTTTVDDVTYTLSDLKNASSVKFPDVAYKIIRPDFYRKNPVTGIYAASHNVYDRGNKKKADKSNYDVLDLVYDYERRCSLSNVLNDNEDKFKETDPLIWYPKAGETAEDLQKKLIKLGVKATMLSSLIPEPPKVKRVNTGYKRIPVNKLSVGVKLSWEDKNKLKSLKTLSTNAELPEDLSDIYLIPVKNHKPLDDTGIEVNDDFFSLLQNIPDKFKGKFYTLQEKDYNKMVKDKTVFKKWEDFKTDIIPELKEMLKGSGRSDGIKRFFNTEVVGPFDTQEKIDALRVFPELQKAQQFLVDLSNDRGSYEQAKQLANLLKVDIKSVQDTSTLVIDDETKDLLEDTKILRHLLNNIRFWYLPSHVLPKGVEPSPELLIEQFAKFYKGEQNESTS